METRCGKKYKYSIASASASIPWDNLPFLTLLIIFKNLSSLGDRVRVGAVCRHWNLVHREAKRDILGIPDSPWKILLDDLYNIPFIAEVGFKSLSDGRVYRFNLPDGLDNGWVCGSSRGWLLMASGDPLSPDLFLWNPLNGSVRNLPPLSAHPCYSDFRYKAKHCVMDIWSVFERVQVFSHGSAECVVVAILHKEIYPRNRISFCTPRDKRWSTYGKKEDRAVYVDVVYHEKLRSLWLLTGGDLKASAMDRLRSRGRGVCLSEGCNVPVRSVFLNGWFRDQDEHLWAGLPRRSRTSKKERQVFRLVEDTVHEDGDVLVVETNIDREFRVHYPNDGGAKQVMLRDRTAQVSFVVPFDEENRFQELDSIGDRTVFLGSTCTNSIIVSNPVKGIETDCAYLAIDDALGCFSVDDEQYKRGFRIREQGVYSLKGKKMRNDDSRNVGCAAVNKIGWFEPKIFLK